MTTAHLQELDRTGLELGASPFARENAKNLATGYGDLIVVLLEPTDKAETHCYDAMKASSPALQLVDETLTMAFAGQRNVENTIILDRRPFRSAEIQGCEDERTTERNNQKAYQGFEAAIAILRPKVIVVCQCRDTVPDGQLSDQWSSSVSKSGDYDIVQMGNEHKCFRVYSSHPMHFQRIGDEKGPLKRVLLEYLYDATFVIAANLLAGREISGFGLSNLRNCARQGPIGKFSEVGVILTYQWTDEESSCSDELWALMKDVGMLQ
ncbi:hypothetical protein COCVIDRAFT_116074 [Bipolaris victoriae FI3]|uniref:Uncharacterized protein n=1 Tax=Bipolaris victoriae (strain FI3) TaxID=930091 RepID=W7E0P6_BIPV3|nr:hypothetical protein COCVIDRAFT_116074 [Bipolaris victoriae FI3]